MTREVLAEFTLQNQAGTEKLALTLADRLTVSGIVALTGDLGAGKSTFARAFIRASLDDDDAEVPSPTFTLVQTYETPDGREIWHADLYRLSDQEEAFELGLDEAREEAVCLIEWPDRMPDEWMDDALEISIEIGEAGVRHIQLIGERGHWASLAKEVCP